MCIGWPDGVFYAARAQIWFVLYFNCVDLLSGRDETTPNQNISVNLKIAEIVLFYKARIREPLSRYSDRTDRRFSQSISICRNKNQKKKEEINSFKSKLLIILSSGRPDGRDGWIWWLWYLYLGIINAWIYIQSREIDGCVLLCDKNDSLSRGPSKRASPDRFGLKQFARTSNIFATACLIAKNVCSACLAERSDFNDFLFVKLMYIEVFR